MLEIPRGMKKIGGLRRKTRCLFRKHRCDAGKLSLTNYLRIFKEGDQVRLSVDSSIQQGMYHPRFYGKSGIVKTRAGRCYEVLITDGSKQKTLIIHPIHLKKC